MEGHSFAVVGTGALVRLRGGEELQGLHISTGSSAEVLPAGEKLRGVKSQAVVNSEALTKFACHIAGVLAMLGSEYVEDNQYGWP